MYICMYDMWMIHGKYTDMYVNISIYLYIYIYLCIFTPASRKPKALARYYKYKQMQDSFKDIRRVFGVHCIESMPFP